MIFADPIWESATFSGRNFASGHLGCAAHNKESQALQMSGLVLQRSYGKSPLNHQWAISRPNGPTARITRGKWSNEIMMCLSILIGKLFIYIYIHKYRYEAIIVQIKYLGCHGILVDHQQCDADFPTPGLFEVIIGLAVPPCFRLGPWYNEGYGSWNRIPQEL